MRMHRREKRINIHGVPGAYFFVVEIFETLARIFFPPSRHRIRGVRIDVIVHYIYRITAKNEKRKTKNEFAIVSGGGMGDAHVLIRNGRRVFTGNVRKTRKQLYIIPL